MTLNIPIVIATFFWLVLCIVLDLVLKNLRYIHPSSGMEKSIGCVLAVAGWGVLTVFYCIFWIIYLLVTK